MARNPSWTVEEIILATEVLIDNEFRVVGPNHPDVITLSHLLNALPIHPHEIWNDEFRSPSSIDRKLANIRSVDPNWTGGKTHGSKIDDYFWRVLGGETSALKAAAEAIRRTLEWSGTRPRIEAYSIFSTASRIPAPNLGRLDDLSITPIHRERLKWFLEHEGRIVHQSAFAGVTDPWLTSRAKGIYKPSTWDYSLSVKETLSSSYADIPIQTLESGDWIYRYHREDGSNKYTNQGLVRCMEDGVPIGVIIQVSQKPDVRYFVAGLGLIWQFDDPWFILVTWHQESQSKSTNGSYATQAAEKDSHHVQVTDTEIVAPEINRFATRLVRPNQPMFRVMLLSTYERTCAVTESQVVPVLEAAHIQPYSYEKIDKVNNGLLLRADVHRLFDRGFIGVDTAHMETVVSPKLIGSEYEQYAGKALVLPTNAELSPSVQFLDEHRRAWRLS